MTQFQVTSPKSEVKEKGNVAQETAVSNSCCSTTKQETCCEPSAKSECCGPTSATTTGTCGCQ